MADVEEPGGAGKVWEATDQAPELPEGGCGVIESDRLRATAVLEGGVDHQARHLGALEFLLPRGVGGVLHCVPRRGGWLAQNLRDEGDSEGTFPSTAPPSASPILHAARRHGEGTTRQRAATLLAASTASSLSRPCGVPRATTTTFMWLRALRFQRVRG